MVWFQGTMWWVGCDGGERGSGFEGGDEDESDGDDGDDGVDVDCGACDGCTEFGDARLNTVPKGCKKCFGSAASVKTQRRTGEASAFAVTFVSPHYHLPTVSCSVISIP